MLAGVSYRMCDEHLLGELPDLPPGLTLRIVHQTEVLRNMITKGQRCDAEVIEMIGNRGVLVSIAGSGVLSGQLRQDIRRTDQCWSERHRLQPRQ
jgi:hypothetical protein